MRTKRASSTNEDSKVATKKGRKGLRVCGILIDGLILTAVLSMLTGQDIGSDLGGLFKAGLLALGASLVGAAVSVGVSIVGPAIVGELTGLLVTGVLLALAIATAYALDVKSALIGGATFIFVKLVFTIAMLALGYSL